MPQAFDLIVTVTAGQAESIIPQIKWKHPRARAEVVPNKGRDWASMVMLANRGLLSGYDAVAKVHTKKSEHRIDGDGWRLALLDGIFESPEQIQRTIDLLKEDRSVGLVVPTGHVAGTESWGSDEALVEMLAYRMTMAFDPDELRFPAGSMFWCRPWLLERLADLDINDDHFEPEAGQYDATTAHALERLIGVFATVGGMDAIETMDVRSRLAARRREPAKRPKVFTFYLPQYHQVPENDEFWGEGFTDWVNVAKARPLFAGHRQPLLPSHEVGQYDLSHPSVLRRQAQQAKIHGIEAFVFHYYWFDGRRVLERPLQNWLTDPSIDLSVAISWANEPWTRRWDGLNDDVLIPQELTAGWEDRFIADVAPYMADPRYQRVDGMPMLLIYRPDLLPAPGEAVQRLRAAAQRHSLPGLHLLFVRPSRDFGALPVRALKAADGLVSFPPGSAVRLEHIVPPNNWKGRRVEQFLSYDSAASLPAVGEPSYQGIPN
ncbi:MAG: glycoside hydrolase family 99-like domain-containing protein, partial [Gammaproteobacteria bacterium]|nr:glycoside hydrolase family 99-like domain-containing protein [Gammaproteobacteria bacterium]